MKLAGYSLLGQLSTDPFHSGYTIWYCSIVRSLITHQCKGADWVFSVRVQCLLLQVLCGDQLRFSLCSGAIITRCWFQFISYLLVSSPAHLMQSYASHLLPSLLRCWSCLLFLCKSPLVLQLFCCVSLSMFWASAASFIQYIFCNVCWDSLSVLCMLG